MKDYDHLIKYYIVCYCEAEKEEKVAYYALNFEENPLTGVSFTWLRTFVVNEEYRGQGIFRKCFKIIKEEAKLQGSQGIRLYVSRESEGAYKIYQHYGFVTEPVKTMEVDTVYFYSDTYSKQNIIKTTEDLKKRFILAANYSSKNDTQEAFTLERLEKQEMGYSQLDLFQNEISDWKSILGNPGISEKQKQIQNVDLKAKMYSYVDSNIQNSLFLVKNGGKVVGMLMIIDEFCDCSGGLSCWITDCYLKEDMIKTKMGVLESIGRINLAILEAKEKLGIVQWNWLVKEDLQDLEEKFEEQGLKDFGDDVMTYYFEE